MKFRIQNFRKILFSWMVLCIFFATYELARADEIVFVGDKWPPFNATPNSDTEGYAIDILRAVFEPEGHTVVYKLLPWPRAVQEVNKGRHNGLLGPFKSEAPGMVFPEEIIGVSALAFFTRIDSDWTFTGLESLDGVSMALVRDYGYRPWLQEYRKLHPENFTILAGKEATERVARMLIHKRVDVIPGGESRFQYLAKSLGFENQIRFAGRDVIGETKKLYVAFSPKNPQSASYAETLSNGIRELRRTGKLATILKKYGLHDWQLPQKP